MDLNLDKLKKIISEAKISNEDKENLIAALAQAGEQELKDVVNLLEEDSSLVELINNNLKLKAEAFRNKDKKMWKDILEEECKILDSLENK